MNGTAGDVTVNNGGTLSGAGTVDTVTLTGTATVSPGNSPGILNTGSVTTSSGITFNFELAGPAPGTGHDQIGTTGTIALDGTLVVSLTYQPAVNDVVYLWLNDSNEPITGTFTGLPEGSSIPTPGGGSFAISYVANGDLGSTGNDVGLTWIPGPSSPLLAGAAAILGLRRRFGTHRAG